MDKELMQLNDTQHFESLKSYVSNLDVSYISSELSKIVWQNEGAAVVQTLLTGLGNTRRCLDKKFQVAETILNEIEGKQLPARVAEKLVDVLAGEMDCFTASQLLRLVDYCCYIVKKPNSETKFSCWKELLPKLLHLLVGMPSVDHGGSQMTGEQYKNSVITSLCMAEWTPAIVVDLAAMFIDMPMNKDERGRVVRKLCKLLNTLSTEQIGPLSSQLLILTQAEHSMLFFLALASYFNTNLYDKMEKSNSSIANNSVTKSLKEVSNMEGTILYNVVSNPAGCKQLLKTLKTCVSVPQLILQPFLVTLLLALSSVPAYEEEALSTLRAGFNRALTEADKMNDSAWLRTVCPSALDVNKLISRVLENCFRGRDTVLKGLVNLGFNLLGAGRGCDGLHALGTSILEHLVRRNKLVTQVVLKTLNNHIYQVADSSQFTDCLLVLARKQPLSLMECTSALVEMLDTCLRVPSRAATHVLIALLPLARLSHSIRDSIVVILRKALFPHDVDRRIMAVRGFLELLRDLKISNLQSLSQSMSQNYCNMTQLCSQSFGGGGTGTGGSQSNEGLCLEILSVLREVFKRQFQVKIILYRGVYSSVRANPELGPHALDYLQTHMEDWYEAGDTLPPLRFHDAVAIQGDDAVLLEPLGEFLLCLSLLAAKLEDSTRSSRLQDMLDSLCRRMTASTIADLRLDPDEGFIMDTTAMALKSQEVIRQILSSYEALLGYLLCAWNKGTPDKSDKFWQLFKAYICLCDYARGLGKTDKKKGDKKAKNDKGKFRFPATVLNFKCCARLLTIVNNVPAHWATEESRQLLRGKRELHRYATRVTLEVIQDAKTATPSELSRDCHNIGYLCAIGRILYTKYVCEVTEMSVFDMPATVTALQAFSELIALVTSHCKSKLPNFISEIAGEPLGSQNENALKKLVEAVAEQLGDVLSGEDALEEGVKEDVQTRKMPNIYLALFNALVAQLPPESAFLLQMYEKIQELCCEKNIKKPGLAKPLLGMLLSVNRRACDATSLMSDLAAALTASMELLDEEMEVEVNVEYGVVNEHTGNMCVSVLCESLQQHLNDVDWIISRFKAELVSLQYPCELSFEHRHNEQRTRENDLCRHLNYLVKVLSGLCSLALPSGVVAEGLLRTLELMYNRLFLLTRYFIMKNIKFKDNMDGHKFVKTVRLVDSELTKNMFCFTDHLIKYKETSSVKDNQLKARVMKEARRIPKVVLEKEQYHKLLLELSKRTKCDLASKLKQAQTRDYRFVGVKEALETVDSEEMEIEEDESEPGENEISSEENESSPVPKRRRRSNVVTDTQEESLPCSTVDDTDDT